MCSQKQFETILLKHLLMCLRWRATEGTICNKRQGRIDPAFKFVSFSTWYGFIISKHAVEVEFLLKSCLLLCCGYSSALLSLMFLRASGFLSCQEAWSPSFLGLVIQALGKFKQWHSTALAANRHCLLVELLKCLLLVFCCQLNEPWTARHSANF